ncbi:MAG TPA: hypothetical protein VNX65_04380 [Patescibacteria group bacterium]|jgi:hypothetical protein|nr:hypothetical protein [Patescibacteria group bacterium]
MATQTTSSVTDFEPHQKASFFYPLEGEIIRTASLGAVAGLTIPLFSAAFDQWFIKPVFCHANQAAAFCSSTRQLSYGVFTALFATGAIAILVHWQVFRPVLVTVAAGVSMWGFGQQFEALATRNLFEYLVFSIFLYAIIYLLFYWLVRLRRFAASLIVTIGTVIILRWFFIL